MSIQYLSSAHFSSAGGRALRCNLPGIVFVMFKSDGCQHCRQTLPLIQQFAKQDMRLTWAVADVGQYRDVVAMSKTTSTPIRAVPMFILYVEGRPHANYKGPRNAPKMKKFIDDILLSLNTNNKNFAQPSSGSGNQNPFPQPSYQPLTGGQGIPDQESLHEAVMNLPKGATPHNAPYMAYNKFK